jgi:tetratricopeptide (TPR) repeat protein
VKERLTLFIHVCHAIQHAHQKGVIHRDIKPSNILVAIHDGQAIPKIIDFGIAKATEIRPHGATMSTAMDQPVGTPAYMSPEQVDMGGIDIDTRSDVYGLGALLYELLAGRPPFDGEALMKSGMSEMRRILLEKEPPPPSASLSAGVGKSGEIATRRRSDPNRLVSILSGDLDWIVMKAMDKDRNRRYQTANSLAMDVQRFLSDEPVIARRPGKIYLLKKFVRRNLPACISAAAVALSLVVGMGAATVLYLRERQALIEQEWLRKDAEAARAEEARLRKQTQARANVSRVAVLLSEGKIEEADSLLSRSPLSSVDPSPEAAGVFRSLGNWNAAYGRWRQAMQCFYLLHQANRLDGRSNNLEGLDLLFAAPVYLESGDVREYNAFRRRSLDLYLPVRNSLEAEHLLKACLLIPADPETLARLEQVAGVCEAAVPANSGWVRFREWEALSLALYFHRRGDSEKTLQWSSESLGYPDEAGSRASAILCLTSMAHQRSGNRNRALEDFRKAEKMIPPPPDPKARSQSSLPGTWLSWSVARILLREARAALKP